MDIHVKDNLRKFYIPKRNISHVTSDIEQVNSYKINHISFYLLSISKYVKCDMFCRIESVQASALHGNDAGVLK